MNFEYSEKVAALREQVQVFIDEHIIPNEKLYHEQVAANRWAEPAIMTEKKALAKEQGLWNFFLPPVYGEYSGGLTNLEYAPLAELMGRGTFFFSINAVMGGRPRA